MDAPVKKFNHGFYLMPGIAGSAVKPGLVSDGEGVEGL
jgi:hypothetical protein